MSRIILFAIAFLFQNEAEQTVEQMRGLSMQFSGLAPGNGVWSKEVLAKREILRKLHQSGKASIPPLVHALKDSDVQMRRNAALTMIQLAAGYSVDLSPPLDISEAIPDLIEAMEDEDASVRAWAASAVAETRSNSREVIAALLKLLEDPDEGPRNNSCRALGRIGPAAKEALPALYKALNDPGKDVRRFAQQAIDKIQQN